MQKKKYCFSIICRRCYHFERCTTEEVKLSGAGSSFYNKKKWETVRTKNGVVSGEALEKSAEGAMQQCRISQAKGQSQKDAGGKKP